MDEVYHAKPLSMTFCLDCHRNPAMHLRPLDKITDLDWKATDNEPDWQSKQLALGQRSSTTGMFSRCKIVRPVTDENDSSTMS